MFQIGDEVLVTKNYMGATIAGLTARVIANYSIHGLSLEFDLPIRGVSEMDWHNCRGHGKHGYCWNVPDDYLESVEKDNRNPIERKCRRLWNKSKWVQSHKLAY